MRLPAVAVFTVLALFSTSNRAQATFSVTINVPGQGTFTVNDNDTPPGTDSDVNPAINNIHVVHNGSGSDLSFNGVFQIVSTNSSLLMKVINLNFSNDTIAGTPTDFNNITITVSDSGLSQFAGSPNIALFNDLNVGSGTSGVTYGLTSSIDNPSASTPPISITAVTFPTGGSSSTNVMPIATYTLTSVYTISQVSAGRTFNLGGSDSGLANTAPVPGGLALLATALPVGLCMFRRKTNSVAV
jgi:hypothetical protein